MRSYYQFLIIHVAWAAYRASKYSSMGFTLDIKINLSQIHIQRKNLEYPWQRWTVSFRVTLNETKIRFTKEKNQLVRGKYDCPLESVNCLSLNSRYFFFRVVHYVKNSLKFPWGVGKQPIGDTAEEDFAGVHAHSEFLPCDWQETNPERSHTSVHRDTNL